MYYNKTMERNVIIIENKTKMNNCLPYVPDIDRLLNTLRKIGGSRQEDWDGDGYASFWIDNGAVVLQNQEYTLSTSFLTMASNEMEEARNAFWKWIGTSAPVVAIIEVIGKDGMDIQELIARLSNTYPEQDTRVRIAWMERLGVIRVDNGKYVLNDGDVEFDEDTRDGIYPIDIEDTIDIKDDKFSVFEYIRKVNDGKIIMNPDFQRNEVWTIEQKSQLIESTMLEIPIPAFYMKKDAQGRLIVVDGLQRTLALRGFLNDDFRLCGLNALDKVNGYKCSEMRKDDKLSNLVTRVEDRQLLFYVISKDTPMSIVYDIFNRINTGGTKLERQEIRNCIFIGHSTRLLKELSAEDAFKKAIDGGISAKRMKDREAALRCIAFTILDYKKVYARSMDDFLERAMRKINKSSMIEVEDMKKTFLKIMKQTRSIFGTANFRIPSDYTRGRINIAVMETIYYVFFKKAELGQTVDNNLMRQSFQTLLKDSDYLDAVRNSTGSPSKVMTRFELAKQIFSVE